MSWSMIRAQRRLLALPPVALVVAVGALLLVTPARADTFEVCPTGCAYNSIGAALAAASTGDTITLASGTYLESALEITDEIEIVGADRDGVVIDAEGDGASVFLVQGTGVLTLQNLTVRGGDADTQGGAVYSTGIVVAQDVTFEDNQAGTSGGAIFQSGGGLTLQDVTFEGNSAAAGGAIDSDGADTSIIRALFGTTSDSVRMDMGSVAYSSFPAGAETLTSTGATPVSVTHNWWGHESGPTHPNNPLGTGATIGGNVSFTPWIASIEVTPSATDLTVGETVSVSASTLDSEGDPVALLDLPLALSVGGANAHSSDSTDGTHEYVGTNAGTDTVFADPLFGGESAGLTSLWGSAGVTWAAAPSDGGDDDEDPEPTPPLLPPSPGLTALENFETLMQAGIFPGLGAPTAFVDALRAAQFGTIGSLLGIGENGSQAMFGLPFVDPLSWATPYIETFQPPLLGIPVPAFGGDPFAGFMTMPDSASFAIAAFLGGDFPRAACDTSPLAWLFPSAILAALDLPAACGAGPGASPLVPLPGAVGGCDAADLVNIPTEVLPGCDSPAPGAPGGCNAADLLNIPTELMPGCNILAPTAVVPWGIVAEFSGIFQAAANAFAGLLPIEAASSVSTAGVPDGQPTLVTLEVAAADLPAGVRPEQITLARVDRETLSWVAVESVVVPLEDGAFGCSRGWTAPATTT